MFQVGRDTIVYDNENQNCLQATDFENPAQNVVLSGKCGEQPYSQLFRCINTMSHNHLSLISSPSMVYTDKLNRSIHRQLNFKQ